MGGLLLGSVGLRHPIVSSRNSGSGPKPTIARLRSTRRALMQNAYQARALRQVRQVLEFLPRYHALVALELGALAALAAYVRRRSGAFRSWIQPALIGLTLFDLAVLGFDLNPAIPAVTHAQEPRVIARLRKELPPRWPGPRAGRRAAAQRPHAVWPFRRAELRLGRAGLQPVVVQIAL